MENAGTLTVGAALDDPARLDALARIHVDTAPDAIVFDRLTALVTSLLDVPIALLTLVTPDSQIFFSVAGIDKEWQRHGAVPVTNSFCQHAVRSGLPFAIGDARTDPRDRVDGAKRADRMIGRGDEGDPEIRDDLVEHGVDVTGARIRADVADREW